MKKEIFFAVLLGLAVGLIITYGVYRAQTGSIRQQAQTFLESPPPTSSPEVSSLVLHSPLDESIVDTAEVAVAGTTQPSSFVVIFTNDKETITTADTTGAFSSKSTLETGSNVITVYSLNEDGQVVTKEIVVIYTTQPLEESASTQAATASADKSEPL